MHCKLNSLMSGDDLALAYEAVIRKCWECNRTQHHGNADVYRNLQKHMMDSYTKNDFKSCQQSFKEVVDALIEALNQKEFNHLVSQLKIIEGPNYATLQLLSYILGKAEVLLQK